MEGLEDNKISHPSVFTTPPPLPPLPHLLHPSLGCCTDQPLKNTHLSQLPAEPPAGLVLPPAAGFLCFPLCPFIILLLLLLRKPNSNMLYVQNSEWLIHCVRLSHCVNSCDSNMRGSLSPRHLILVLSSLRPRAPYFGQRIS